MKIEKVLLAPGVSSFFFDDQRAVKASARHDGFTYSGKPVTPGFNTIRTAGECISIMLLLDNGEIAQGDCAAVQYSGAGGRDPLFKARNYIPLLERHIVPRLSGMDIGPFRTMAERFENIDIEGKRLHTAIRYGLSQALLHARAIEHRRLMCEVVSEEYGVNLTIKPVPIFAQSGDDRYSHADKMILKGADVLPHALINTVDEKLGRQGELLKEYISWLTTRIRKLRTDESYVPSLHIDVYGTIGQICDGSMEKTADYIASLEGPAGEFPLYIEGPVDMEEKGRQIEALKAVTDALKKKGSSVKIVADEWCNTYEDIVDFTDAKSCHMVQIKTPDLGGIQNTIQSVLYCKENGMEAYQGGTCNETDISARACVHAAFAVKADRMLAKPGMGFDEGYTIVRNEMERIMAILHHKKSKEGRPDIWRVPF